MLDHCPVCKAEYQHIQHPGKPAGVIMMSVCKCVPSVQAIEGGTITTFDPPSDDEPPTDHY